MIKLEKREEKHTNPDGTLCCKYPYFNLSKGDNNIILTPEEAQDLLKQLEEKLR